MIYLTTTGDKLVLKSFYDPEAAKRYRNLDGDWQPPHWVFPHARRPHLERFLCKRYGGVIVDGFTGVLVRLTCLIGHETRCDSARWMNIPVATAFGRDSGARTPDSVALLEGTITSGGSMKNWTTIVRPGALFELTIPAGTLAAYAALPVGNSDNKDHWHLEPVSPEKQEYSPDPDALRAELRALYGRAREIIKRLPEGGDLAGSPSNVTNQDGD